MEDASLADGFMPPDVSPETRRFVEIVTAVKLLEHDLPLLLDIKDIENLRSQTIALVKWAEEREGKLWGAGAFVEELKRYGVRVGQMCQRQKMQLLRKAHSSRAPAAPEPSASSAPPPPPPLPEGTPTDPLINERDRSPVAPPVSAEQKESLVKAIRAKARARGEKIDEKTVRLRLRWRLARMGKVSRRNKARGKRSEGAPRALTSPSDKFSRYWTKEKKLLYQYFETSDLAWLAERWWKEFHAYRAEAEKILSEHRQERERRKAVAELSKA